MGGCVHNPIPGHWEYEDVEYGSKLVRAFRRLIGLSSSRRVATIFVPRKSPPAPPAPPRPIRPVGIIETEGILGSRFTADK